MAVICSGCQGWGTRDESFRKSDLSAVAHKARSNEDAEKQKANDDPRLSERANQVSRDLQ
jgi:hypothetical protein